VPEGKPIRFTELGCGAIDKAANQPNVFPDAKSNSGLPHYSTGARDDLIQRRFLSAHLSWWNPDDPDFDEAANPPSSVYAGRMIDPAAIHIWTWDARPYPHFPLRDDLWSDGANWETGHWLTGRLGAPSAEALVEQILADYGASDIAAVGDLEGQVDGFLIDRVMSARSALEPLSQLLLFEAFESGDRLRFERRGRRARQAFAASDLVEEGSRPLVAIRRAQETELPAEIGFGFLDGLADYRPTSVNSRRLVGGSSRVESTETGVVMTHAVAGGLADTILQDIWAGRETVSLALPRRSLALEAADICTLEIDGAIRTLMVSRIEDAGLRRIEARTIEPDILSAVPAAPRILPPPPVPALSRPEIVLLDLPLLTGSEPPHAPRIAAFAEPWPGTIAVSLGSAASGFIPRQALERRATMGVLTAPLAPGPIARLDRGNAIEVQLYGGALASAALLGVLNGANAAAIGTSEGVFEVVQFETAELVAENTWRLSGLLRGQGGTADVAAAGHDAGAQFVLLDRAVVPLALTEAESGLALTLRCGAAGAVYDPETFADVPLIPSRRGLRCLAPVHLQGARDQDSGGVEFRWIRQTRIGGDGWEQVEVPLGEAAEAYRLEVRNGATVVRTIDVGAPNASYSAADQIADFGDLPDTITVAVAQISATEGAGTAESRTLQL
jgi:hypothetical protein